MRAASMRRALAARKIQSFSFEIEIPIAARGREFLTIKRVNKKSKTNNESNNRNKLWKPGSASDK